LLKNNMSFLTVLAPVFFLLSCTGSPADRDDYTELAAVQNNNSEISVQERQKGSLWICGVQEGQLIIFGVSSRLSKPNDEIEAAKQDAAGKASMYHGIQGSVTAVNYTGSNILEYTSDTVINLNYDTDLTRYLDRLSFDAENDVTRTSGTSGSPGAVIIRMKYNASDLVNVNYNSVIRDGSPTWINNRDMPEIPGYAVTVGISGRKSQLRDTIVSSMQAAAARLIENTSTQMNAVDKTTSGAGSSTSMRTSSSGQLSNFHALEIWIADNGSVYTLAIARAAR